jgi:hypothetical protein
MHGLGLEYHREQFHQIGNASIIERISPKYQTSANGC